jgi:hypothetical protein
MRNAYGKFVRISVRRSRQVSLRHGVRIWVGAPNLILTGTSFNIDIRVMAWFKRGDVIPFRSLVYSRLFRRTRCEKPFLDIFMIYVIGFAVRTICKIVFLQFHYFYREARFCVRLKIIMYQSIICCFVCVCNVCMYVTAAHITFHRML